MKVLLPRLFAFCLGLGLLSLLGGCMSGHLNSVTVSIAEIKPSKADNEVILTLRYSNENVIPIGLSNTTHKLFINGKLFGKAVSDNAVGMPPMKMITDVVSLRVENSALMQELVSLASSKTATYKLESRLFLMSGEDKVDIKTTFTDTIDLHAFAR